MENNQFTRIGTFCEKCREVMCRCYEYEQNLKEMDKKLNGFNNGRDITDGAGGRENTMNFTNNCEPCEKAKQEKLKESIEVLCNTLREDTSEGSYYYSWMCNLKMSFYDAVQNCTINDFETGTDEKELLNACENGAKNFLNLLIKQ